eukprot:jgi/Psemu1/307570/fgenesh1_kg.340_\
MEQDHTHFPVNIDVKAELAEQQTSTKTNNLEESNIISFFEYNARDFEGGLDDKEIIETETTTITANEEESVFDRNALRPVRQKDVYPVLTAQVKEEPPDEGDSGNRQRRAKASEPTATSTLERIKHGHLRRQRQ